MKTIEIVQQLYLRFGKVFVDLYLLERQFRGLNLADDWVLDYLEMLEQFKALVLANPSQP